MSDERKKCGEWMLGREIGRGAFGVVYLGKRADGATAAVKVCIRDELSADRYERELRGARLYRSIPASEGLVRLLELGECEWGFYEVLELADEEFGAQSLAASDYRPKTLSRVIAGEKALSVKESLKLGLALAKGLVTLQRHHLLHRDIKPGNVIYVRGRPVLSDPGLLVDEAEAVSLVGTPGYVPPENFVAAGGDVYSLGLTLKAASFGRPVDELEKGPTLEADTDNPLFPAWWRILNKATNPDAARRYRSAKALLRELQAYRRRIALSVFSWKVPFFVEVAVIGLFLLMGWAVFKAKLVPYGYTSREDRERAAAARAIDEFVARRVKEDMPDVRKAIKDIRTNVERSTKEFKRDIQKLP